MAKKKESNIIIQGHRGCTGYYPENAIDGFLYSIKNGISYLELDIVVSKDYQLIVSHDPYFRSEISLTSEGNKITKEEEKEHCIYKMNLEEIQEYKCINDNNFVNQYNHEHVKPSLEQLITAIVEFCNSNNLSLPHLTIEPKSREEWIPYMQPSINKYALLIKEFHKKFLIDFEVTYHSFDIDLLKELNKFKDFTIDVLYENIDSTIKEELSMLNFKPNGVGLKHTIVTKNIVSYLKANNYSLSVWTVNTQADIERMLDFGVTNIISDYPILVKQIIS